MSSLTLGGFLKLSKQQKIDHFNQNVAKADPKTLTRWELALRKALEENTADPLKLYSGLIPFCKSVNIVREIPEPTATELMLEHEVDPKIANLFEGLMAMELLNKSDEEILAIKGVGKKTLATIKSIQEKLK